MCEEDLSHRLANARGDPLHARVALIEVKPGLVRHRCRLLLTPTFRGHSDPIPVPARPRLARRGWR